jgi:hypothetical protein
MYIIMQYISKGGQQSFPCHAAPSMAVGTLSRVLTHPPEIKKDSLSKSFVITRATNKVAERAGFEPANAFTRYSISNRAPSAILSHLSIDYSIVFMLDIACFSGGESEIRTHEAGFSRLLDFESSAFDQLGHLSSNP